MNGLLDGLVVAWIVRWMIKWKDGWLDERMIRWIDVTSPLSPQMTAVNILF